MESIQQLRELRANLPKGKKDPWFACCKNKRVLLGRALHKADLSDLTAGEKAVIEEWLAYIPQVKREINLANRKLERTIAKIAQP